MEKNPNIIPKDIDNICRSVFMHNDEDPNISFNKSSTALALKTGTAELIQNLAETVSMIFNEYLKKSQRNGFSSI